MRLTILGCGPSGGVPLIGCGCDTCTDSDPRNTRSRASVLIEEADTRLLVDMSPDLRSQSLREGISAIDAIFVTHDHADHVHGIDDIKRFNYQKDGPIPCYGDTGTIHALRQRFAYAMARPDTVHYGFRPAIALHEIEPYQEVRIGGLQLTSFLQLHGKMPSMGLRVGNIAYSTDVNNLPEKSLQALESLDVWVVDCLQRTPAPSHAHLAMTLEWIARLKPKLAILTHMSHALEYRSLKRELPANVIPAYDGLSLHIPTGTSGVLTY